eukprot:TRINITY_DN6198_c0_g1_i7.p1 TRINITY_DN6198_c0_g1~~TRINITY_DN6198_c0_g1_i7.p1  ORF type:complete len:429 (+),score=56.15 TRINITY_DN6198_c0_g1_i7:50-1336(+)
MDSESSQSDCERAGLLTNEAPSPNPGAWKWLALFLICSFGAGSFFCFDLPGAAGVEIIEALEINYFQFGFIYSIYCIPNAILVFFGSQMFNKLGIRWVAVIYTLCVALGQMISSIGIRTEVYEIVLIGRAVFGIGGESLAVIQNYTVTRWFQGKESSFAFSTTLFFSRMGSILCFATIPTLVQELGHDSAEWIGAWICMASFVAVLLYILLDHWADSKCIIQENLITDDIDFEELQFFSRTFWWLVAVAITFYMAVFPFVSFSNIFFREEKDMDRVEIGFLTTMVFGVPCAFEPILRMIVDKKGIRGIFISLAMFILVPVYYTFAYTELYPGYGMFLIGLSHALISVSLFPCLPLLIEMRQVGTALSMQQALIDLGLGVGPVVAGALMEYVAIESIMAFFGATASIGNLWHRCIHIRLFCCCCCFFAS